jgi:stage II sporulation protein AA (anti-sigma F factor antagonist)
LFVHVVNRREGRVTDLALGDRGSNGLLKIRRIRDPHAITLELRGELDLSSAPALTHQLAAIQRENPRLVLLDLSNLGFMDSTGLTLIIQAHAAAQASGRQLQLCLGSPQVRRLFEVTGVLDRFIFED